MISELLFPRENHIKELKGPSLLGNGQYKSKEKQMKKAEERSKHNVCPYPKSPQSKKMGYNIRISMMRNIKK